jgi:hypothetical protein
MAVRIQFRRGTAAEWAASNPTLAPGELGYETDTALFKIGTGATTWANLVYTGISTSYVDSAIANVIDMSPETLDTLQELAAALGDDPNFSNTVSNTFATKISFIADTDSNLQTANAITTLNAIYITDILGSIKIGDGVTRYNNLKFVGEQYTDTEIGTHNSATTNVHGIGNTANLVEVSALNNLANTVALKATIDSPTFTGTVILPANTSIATVSSDQISYLANVSSNIQDQLNSKAPTASPTFTGSVSLPDNTSIGNVSSTEIGYLNNVSSSIQTQLDAKVDSSTASITYAPINGPTFTGVVSLPETTSIGNVSSTEIGYLNNVSSSIQTQLDAKAPSANATFTGTISLPVNTSIGDISSAEIGYLDNVSSNIQSQLDAKLATSSAASIYAPLTDPTFINSVTLPANTTIGVISSTEIGYLDNVSSNIQTQLDAKAPTASPTFTGTVSGITATMVGLGNVNNTSDLDKPISNATQTALDAKAPLANATFSGTISLPSTTSIGDISATEIGYLDNVSSNIQTQINSKLSLSGGTMTGDITLAGAPTQALHPATKAYVDNISAGLHVHEATHAATSNTLANLTGGSVTYDNGTDGVGATLTLGTALTTLDGHSLNNGDRILVKNEATAAHNGVYVRTSSTLLTRADDFNSAAEIAGGDLVFVENGTLYNSTSWVVENEVNTVGTDDILWAQFSGAGTVTAGNNISVSGLQVSVVDSPSFTGTVTLPATTSIGPVSGTEIGYLDNVSSNIQTQLDSKAPIASPTFTGLVTVAANGIAFTDGTQTKQGVPSITVITSITDSYTLSSLSERDTIIEISNSSATTLTIPADSTVNFPVGTTLDIIQTGTGQVTIANAVGVTLNATPGLKLRARWSSATLLKRAANTWLAFGDLSA